MAATSDDARPTLLVMAGWSSAGLVLIQLLSFASMWIVSRALGPDSYGRLGLALVFGLYAFQIVHAGLDAYQTRELSRASRDEAGAILAGILRQKLYAALLVLLLGAVATVLWNRPGERDLIFLGVADGVLLAFSLPAAFDARSATARYFGYAAVRQTVYLGTTAALIFLAPRWLSVEAILLVHAGAILPQLILEYRWIRRQYGAPNFSGAAAHSRAQFKAALPMSISASAYQVAAALGVPALEFFGRHGELGVLVLSNQLAMVAQSLSLIPARVVMARLSAASHNESEFRLLWLRFAFGFGVLAALLSVIGYFLGPWLIEKIWGPPFAMAGTLFAIDVWRVVGAFVAAVTSAALVCQSRLTALSGANVFALLAGFAVIVVFVPQYGAVAAVVGVVMARSVLPLVSAAALLLRPARTEVLST